MTVLSAPSPSPERTKKRVLDMINRHGGLSAQDLAQKLELSVPAARRHLSDLQEQGLIAMNVERPSGRGRPQHVFVLTEQGEATFPKNYSSLCVDVLRHVEQLFGAEAVMRVFEARNIDLYTVLKMAAPDDLPLPERLERITEVLTAAGFDAVIERDGAHYYLVQRNCPNLAVARQFKAVCNAELALYADVLAQPVERDSTIVCGQRVCRYHIAAPDTAPAALLTPPAPLDS